MKIPCDYLPKNIFRNEENKLKATTLEMNFYCFYGKGNNRKVNKKKQIRQGGNKHIHV